MREMPHVGNHGKDLHIQCFLSWGALGFMGCGQRRFNLELQISTPENKYITASVSDWN